MTDHAFDDIAPCHGLDQHSHMKVVKIADAKAHLSAHLRFVERGGRIRITDRARPIADLVPIDARTAGADEGWIDDIERRAVGRRGVDRPLPADFFKARRGASRSRAVEALLDERRSGR